MTEKSMNLSGAKSKELTSLEQLHALSWPASRLSEGVRALAIKSRLVKENDAPRSLFHQQNLFGVPSIDDLAQQWGIEAESVSVLYGELELMLHRSGPALFRLPAKHQNEPEARFVTMIKGGRWRLSILSSDMSVHRIKPRLMRQALCASLEASQMPAIEQLLSHAELAPNQVDALRDEFMRQHLSKSEIKGCWLLRLSPSDSFFKQSLRIGSFHDFARFIFAQVAQELLRLVTVGLIAQATISGQIAWGMLGGALLLWLTRVPFSLLRGWSERMLITNLDLLLKQRLFYGALQLDLDLVKKTGTGQFLAWVLESETIEMAGLRGGILVFQMATTLVVISLLLTVLGGLALGLPLLAWLLFSFWFLWRNITRYTELNHSYSDMTNELLEWLTGHQTRLVQEQNWHGEADEGMARYISIFHNYTSQLTWYVTLVPAGWQLLIMGGLAYKLVSVGAATSAFALGIYFMALSLGFQYIQAMAQVSSELIRAIAAWRLIVPIQQAATIRPEPVRPIPAVMSANTDDKKRVPRKPLILDAQNLLFRYHGRGRAILDHLDLMIREGDQVLLEGPSGGGKSTLASVLTALNSAESGLLLLGGLDRKTIGATAWRKRVVSAPQFHQNHVLSASLAFNLLMGRHWPASSADLAEAEALCRELGLGDLIDQMPQGINQLVGETGWQLSHGERSRLYIARALLQQADLVILDESFASLDPESMEIALQCVLKRVPTLMVIAHP